MTKNDELQEAIKTLAESARVSSEVLKSLNDEMHSHSKECAVHFTQTQDNFNRLISEISNYMKLAFFALALAGGAFGLKEIVSVFVR